MIVVLIHIREPHKQWCVLRCAHPGGRITTLCAGALDYQAVSVLTVDLSDHDSRLPHNTCPACRTEIAAQTPGAALAVEPSQRPTVDMRGGRAGGRQ